MKATSIVIISLADREDRADIIEQARQVMKKAACKSIKSKVLREVRREM